MRPLNPSKKLLTAALCPAADATKKCKRGDKSGVAPPKLGRGATRAMLQDAPLRRLDPR